MKLILTSDFPLTGNDRAFAWMRVTAARPRIAWIPPFTDPGHKRFAQAQTRFATYGFDALEYCDIDEEINVLQLSQLADYDIIDAQAASSSAVASSSVNVSAEEVSASSLVA